MNDQTLPRRRSVFSFPRQVPVQTQQQLHHLHSDPSATLALDQVSSLVESPGSETYTMPDETNNHELLRNCTIGPSARSLVREQSRRVRALRSGTDAVLW
jgi:hypothetical protein